MKNIFIGGSSLMNLGNDQCYPCGTNILPLLLDSSNILWADKIFIPTSVYEDIHKGMRLKEKNNDNLINSIKLFMDRMINHGIMHVVNMNSYLKSIDNELNSNIIDDVITLIDRGIGSPPKKNKDGHPDLLFIKNNMYCFPMLWTIYANLLMSKIYDSVTFFTHHELLYCHNLFKIKEKKSINPTTNKIKEVFNTILPSQKILTCFSFGSDKHDCFMCEKFDSCSKSHIAEINKNIDDVLVIRNSDEMIQLKAVINSIKDNLEKETENYSVEEIISELFSKKQKTEKKLKTVFNKIDNWSNLITIASAPIGAYGIFSDSIIGKIGLAGTAISLTANPIKDAIQKKHRWLSLLNNKSH